MQTTTPNNDMILQLQGVHTHIGEYHILQGVDFCVPRGELTVLLGRNGAGKTTTLRTIMGLWKASAGSIRFNQKEISQLATADIASAEIAYVPENMSVFSDLSVKENLTLAARRPSFDSARLQWIFALFPALEKFWNTPAGHLSGGQKQMLSIARALIEPRQLILIDEPTKGLAPAIIQSMISAFQELKNSQTSVLLVEQNFNFVRQLGDSVVVLEDGRVVHTGSMRDLAKDEALQHSLLGLSLAAHQ